MKYDHKKIERKWQKKWAESKIYQAKDFSKKPKFYPLVEFPYPSGEGLHVGHLRSFTAMDIVSRKRRLEGFNVLYPMGWDAFGLPTENYAVKTGIAPDIVTKKNTDNFRKQLKALGFSFDWDREINTTDPNYYKWTQWMFLQFFKHGLAYKASVPINWCPSCKIGLANEEVIGGKCERCGTEVVKREKEQWMLKITAYAEKLLNGLRNLDFLPEIKKQQENWIGKSEGAEIGFPLAVKNNYVLLHGFTGRSDKIFFPWLKQELEERGHKVFAPQLPNTDKPTENEQVAYVFKHTKFDKNTVLFGHSLGSVVALKVIEKLKSPIAGLVIAGSFMDIKRRKLLNQQPRPYDSTFTWSFDIRRIRRNCGFIKILAATNDSSIPLETSRRVRKNLGGDYQEATAKGDHFTATQEPLILEALTPSIKIFTTRPDTIFGVTYLAISTEHQLVKNLESRIKNLGEVKSFIQKFQRKSALSQRDSTSAEKTGIELKGIKAINPATKKEIPIWITDYVLGDVGTGAIMAVPGHDERDWEFAKRYNLPIAEVIAPQKNADSNADQRGNKAYEGVGELINSGRFSGLDSEKAKWEIIKEIGGKKEVRYKLRDWVFSRQRYWGEPIPLVFCEKCGWVAVPEKDLPVKLPKVKNYKPREDGQSPLASAASWIKAKCPKCGGEARRETDVMPNWAGSSWYYLAYLMRNKTTESYTLNPISLRYWLPVDWYNGGMEHVTLHFLYSRFWNLFLHDIGAVPVGEPYKKRTAHGLILAEGGVKMSKSKGNVVNPDALVREFGADAVRLYEMFIGPFNQAVAWDPQGIVGMSRFLEKISNLKDKISNLKGATDIKLEKLINKTIKKVTEDIESMAFNTALSALMIFINACQESRIVPEKIWRKFLLILAPFAPHIAEELWAKLGNKKSIHEEKWPQYDPKMLAEETFELVIQINGKVRDKAVVNKNVSQAEAEKIALSSQKIKSILAGQKPKKIIFVAGRLINFVVNH